MLRRPPTLLTLTHDDISSYEVNRAARFQRMAQDRQKRQRADQRSGPEARFIQKYPRDGMNGQDEDMGMEYDARAELQQQGQEVPWHLQDDMQMQMEMEMHEGDTEPDEEDDMVAEEDVEQTVEDVEDEDVDVDEVDDEVPTRHTAASAVAAMPPTGRRGASARPSQSHQHSRQHPARPHPRPRPSMPPDEDNPFLSHNSGNSMSQAQTHPAPMHRRTATGGTAAASRPENVMRFLPVQPHAPLRSMHRGGRMGPVVGASDVAGHDEPDSELEAEVEAEGDSTMHELDTPTAMSQAAATARRERERRKGVLQGRGGGGGLDGVSTEGSSAAGSRATSVAEVAGEREERRVGDVTESRERERQRRERIMGRGDGAGRAPTGPGPGVGAVRRPAR